MIRRENTNSFHAGNFYSIANELDKPARIFFSQACEPVLQEMDDY